MKIDRKTYLINLGGDIGQYFSGFKVLGALRMELKIHMLVF